VCDISRETLVYTLVLFFLLFSCSAVRRFLLSGRPLPRKSLIALRFRLFRARIAENRLYLPVKTGAVAIRAVSA
jgi:hypothetical protein